jgi:hypothetical protein
LMYASPWHHITRHETSQDEGNMTRREYPGRYEK